MQLLSGAHLPVLAYFRRMLDGPHRKLLVGPKQAQLRAILQHQGNCHRGTHWSHVFHEHLAQVAHAVWRHGVTVRTVLSREGGMHGLQNLREVDRVLHEGPQKQ
jgi:hypothetical protein